MLDYFKPEFAYGLALVQWKVDNDLIIKPENIYANLMSISKILDITSDSQESLPFNR